jgi:hypothetical protein
MRYYMVFFGLTITLIACLTNPLLAQTFDLKFYPDPFSDDAWLDLRYLNEGVAGENGFIELSDDGRGFVNGRGEPVRFWAVNGASSAGNLDDSQLAAYARSLAKMGVNMVRYHGSLHPRGEGTDINDVNKDVADQIWRTVAAFKREGIYSVISPFWAGMVVPSGGNPAIPESWGLGEYTGNDSPWGVMYFSDRLKEAYKNWVKYLYTTENPYTGIPLRDDPAVALIQIKNEDGLLFYTVDNIKPQLRREMEKKFFSWAEREYGNINLAYDAWDKIELNSDCREDRRLELYIIWEATQPQTGGKAARLNDQVRFYAERQRDFYTELRDFYRELGCRQLINANNWKPAGELMIDAERWSNATVDVMAVNRYYDPQHQGEFSAWRIDPGHTYNPVSVLHQPHLLPINVKQTDGMPFFVTESGWNSPQKYQAEGPFLVSAYMSLTGVNGFFWFNHTGPGIDPDPYFPWWKLEGGQLAKHRWNASIPGQFSMYPANALQFRKGYIKEGDVIISEHRSLDAIFRRDVPVIAESSGFDPNRDFRAAEETDSGSSLPPLAFLTGPVMAVYDSDPSKTYISEDISRLINLKEGTVTSNTGELLWKYRDGICKVDSPRAQGVAGFLREMGEISLSDITVISDNEYAVLNVVSMDNSPVRDSEKVLVQIGTVYQPTGWKEHEDPETGRLVIENTGKMPWRGDAVNMTIRFKNNPRVNSAFLLDNNGYLKEEIPVSRHDGELILTVPENALYIMLRNKN